MAAARKQFARMMFLVVMLAASVSWGQPSSPAVSGPRNAVMIVSVSPETVVDGVETEIEVTVAYELNSHDKALVELTSNSMRAQSMSPFASQLVSKGAGTVKIKGKLTARHWNGIVPTRLGAFLVTMDSERMQRTALASDLTRLALTLRPGAPETQAKNPNPRDIYEDGIRIKSISPDTFVAGQRVEITVVVSYELLSREEGEIGLGFSRGVASGFSVTSKTRVPVGKGEVTLKGWVTPQRTGSLPFGKVHVNLVEYPHRDRFSPLANDSETVEVK